MMKITLIKFRALVLMRFTDTANWFDIMIFNTVRIVLYGFNENWS
jgi:hypothetical protein